MKKILFVLMAVTFSLSAFSQIDFKFKGVGGGLSIGSEAGNGDMGFGLNVGGLAQIMDKIDAEANFIFYFPSDKNGVDYNLIASNANGHYNFYQEGEITAYGLGGLNISRLKWKNSGYSSNNTEIGINIGAGGAYEINDMLDGTAQIGYTIGNADQLFINLGVFYKF